ncbi:DUF6516 family protein [Geobacter grbiciae]|uniref:DUF6516 family protein n=1 Tax=Geobacter grbiciae TaxID=155042 RepID=UPI001C0271A7|nr:DUF6516 family protein [Geobacter grbiciae]MBT1075987.1 hypothetical protein [Geobacter grbiciae]
MADVKIRDERHNISRKRGNGQLRREVWADHHGKVIRYNLAYINYRVFPGDNGRVLGYDNQHGHHHRHFMGKIETMDFVSFEELEERFDQEWSTLLSDNGGGLSR